MLWEAYNAPATKNIWYNAFIKKLTNFQQFISIGWSWIATKKLLETPDSKEFDIVPYGNYAAIIFLEAHSNSSRKYKKKPGRMLCRAILLLFDQNYAAQNSYK
jgi:hypothetical protein